MSEHKLSLREIITLSVKQCLRSQGLLRDELTILVDYILNNSILKYDTGYIELKQGNTLGGVDKSSRDERVEIPPFLLFKFQALRQDEILKGRSRQWELKSFSSLERLESELGYYISGNNENAVAIIDGNIEEFKVIYEKEEGYTRQWGLEVKWSSLNPYKLTYLYEDEEYEEFFKSKIQLKVGILRVVIEGALDIKATNEVQFGRVIHFSVSDEIYNSQDIKSEFSVELIWLGEYEEDDDFGSLGEGTFWRAF